MAKRYISHDVVIMIVDAETVLMSLNDPAKSVPGGQRVRQEIRIPLVQLGSIAFAMSAAWADWKTLVQGDWKEPKD